MATTHGEQPGAVLQRVRVRLAGRPLYSQDLSVGTPGADTPAVLGGRRGVGSVLVVDPDFDAAFDAAGLGVHRLGEHAAVLPLAGPAAVVTAVAADNLALREHLDDGLAALGPPWGAPSSQRTGQHATPDTTHQEAR